MSKKIQLYMSSRVERLAEQLGETLQRQQDPLCAPAIMVPNANLREWLWKYLSENNQNNKTAFNLEYLFLENGVWTLLQGNSERQRNRYEQLGPLEFHLLLLFVLLEDVVYDDQKEPLNPELAPFYSYLYDDERQPRPGFMKRAWGLSAKLYGYLREYLYQRNGDGQYIRLWEAGKPVDESDESDESDEMERAQRAVYRRLFCGSNARLDALNDGLPEEEKRWLLHDFIEKKAAELLPLLGERPLQVHLFGFSHISPFHVEVFRRVSEFIEFNIYHLDCFKSGDPEQAGSDHGLLKLWEVAGVDMLRLLQPLAPQVSVLDTPLSEEVTVLNQLQQSLTERELPPHKITQDSSLQLLACPGERREIEAVYESICAELERDKDLKLHEIGVLVADMDSYRSHIEAVFERERNPDEDGEPLIPYSLSDASRGSSSVYGQAVLQLLRLAKSGFNRQDMFALLCNRVFQTGCGFSRSDVDIWLGWAEGLGIFHNREEVQQRFPLYSWEQAVARLQLGQVMAPLQPAADGVVPDYHGLFPYSDINSDDSGLLHRFSSTVVRLIGRLQRLQGEDLLLTEWCDQLQQLFNDFLAIPADLTRERIIPRRLFEQLETLGRLGGLCSRQFGLTDLTELLSTQLGEIKLTRGRYLHSGVVIAGLHPLRPVPFKMIYLVGMGEGRFPGREDRSLLDLRNGEQHGKSGRLTGDITLAESQYYLFLETLLSVRNKLVISYPAEELQKERPLYPCSVVQTLRFWLGEHLLDAPFQEVRVPLTGYSELYAEPQPAYSDLLVQGYQPSRDIYRKFASAEQSQLTGKERRLNPAMIIKEKKADHISLSLSKLSGFIRNPVEGLLRAAWGVEQLDLHDPAGVRYEPWTTDNMEVITAVEEALSVMLEGWFGGERDSKKLLESGVARLKMVYSRQQQQSLKPDGVQGELDFSVWEKKLTGWWEKLSPELPVQYMDYWPGIVLQDSLPAGSRMKPVGAASVNINGIDFRISGRQGWCWVESAGEEGGPGRIVYLNISRRSKGDALLDSITAKLLYLFSFVNAALPGQQYGSGTVLNSLHDNAARIDLPLLDKPRAERIISQMLASYLDGWLDDLTIDCLKDILKEFEDEPEFAAVRENRPVKDPDFTARIRKRLQEELAEEDRVKKGRFDKNKKISDKEPVRLLGSEDELQGLQGLLSWIGCFVFAEQNEKKKNGKDTEGRSS